MAKSNIDPLKLAEERLDQLKKSGKHKAVYMIAVPTDDTGASFKVAYVHKPDRPVLSRMMSLFSTGNILEATEVLLNSCWIEGDKEILEDDDLFLSASATVDQIVKVRSAVLKKR